MKCKTYGMLALSLGLAFSMIVPAFAAPDRVETEKTNTYRGTSNGQPGTWTEFTVRTYRYVEDAQLLAIRDAFQAVNGREPSQAELDQWAANLKNGSPANLKAWNNQIVDTYQSLMGRKPTSAELLSALQRMANGTSYQTLYNEIYANSAPARVAAAFPGMNISAADAAKIVALGDGRINSIKPPAGIPGESVYPAGLFGDDPNTWRNLFDGGWNWNDRINLANSALGGKSVPVRSYNFNELMNFVGWVSGGWWQNNAESSMVNNLGGVYQVINYGSNPKIAPVFQTSPGGRTTQALLWGSSSSYVDLAYPGGLDRTVAYFMEEGARYLDMYKAFSSVGATAAANEAKSRAQEVMAMLGGVVSDPLVLDLNANGKVDVTGRSSAKIRNPENKNMVKQASVMFDLYRTGKSIRTEWIANGDGLLVDDTKGEATKLIAQGKALTGANLFGDVDGFTGGFFKLMAMDQEAKQASLQTKLTKGFGVLKGKELEGLKVWVDNGDGVAKPEELKSLTELGVTEISLRPQMVKDEKGEILEQSYFVRNGQKNLIQEVWFAHE